MASLNFCGPPLSRYSSLAFRYASLAAAAFSSYGVLSAGLRVFHFSDPALVQWTTPLTSGWVTLYSSLKIGGRQ